MTAEWTTVRDIRARVRRLWDGGRLLADAVRDDGLFPYRVALRGPTSTELGTRFAEVRDWVAAVRSTPHVQIVEREVNHRQLGANRIPVAAVVATATDAAALIGARRDLDRFRMVIEATPSRRPGLEPMLARRSHQVLAAADDWERLLDVVDWVEAHPNPSVYVRQIDVPGVHTKLIEQHQRLLSYMLDAALPAAILDAAAGPSDFERRYGFLTRPRLVRFRALDDPLRFARWAGDGDITISAADFGRIEVPRRVFVTENEINFLSFPATDDAIVVFGAGSGFEHLAGVPWLHDVPVYYWGDIDTHGFALLDQFRSGVPHASSLLMDMDTLLGHRDYWGHEKDPSDVTCFTSRRPRLPCMTRCETTACSRGSDSSRNGSGSDGYATP